MTAATKNKQNQDYGFRDLAPTDPRARGLCTSMSKFSSRLSKFLCCSSELHHLTISRA